MDLVSMAKESKGDRGEGVEDGTVNLSNFL